MSVIVPTLDEAERLPRLLSDIASLRAEVIVADGGSSDDTEALAHQAGARTVRTDPGRGGQLRAGAEAASGRWLLFVHADSHVDAAALGALERFLDTADEDDFAHFDFALDGDDFIHRFIEFGQDLRERWMGLVYGDQGLVVSRGLYDAVGGYPDWPLMEDVGMIQRLERRGRRVPLSATLVTSDRRYAEEGGLRRWMRNVVLLSLFRLGVDPHRLSRWYRPRRRPRGHDIASSRPPRRTVGVFAKAPVPGKVKTRLAADVGDAPAAELYRSMGRTTVDALRDGDYRLIVFGAPGDPESLESIADWLGGEGLEVRPQRDGNLGRRMAEAVAEALTEADAIVLVGTDIPGIDDETMEEAFNRLGDHDVVIGPATDGGYYLVGLTHPHSNLFHDIEWSTPEVLPQTLDRAAAAGLSVSLLAPKSDVDTVDDLTPSLRAVMASGA